MKVADYSVIYNTCDKYEPLWEGFFTLFKKYWRDYTGTIVLNTEEKSINIDGLNIVRPLKSGSNLTWSQRLMNSLDSVTSPYVITFLDDFWLKDYVKVGVINDCLNRMEKDNEIKCFTFAWQPGPNKPDDEQNDFEIRGRFAQYRINAQIALWRVDYLRRILRTYENPWQFELNGSFRSMIYGGKLLSLKKNAPLVFDYDYGFLIIRGRLNKKVADYFRVHENINMELPFDEFNDDEIKHEKPRIRRLFSYFVEMVLSIFKR